MPFLREEKDELMEIPNKRKWMKLINRMYVNTGFAVKAMLLKCFYLTDVYWVRKKVKLVVVDVVNIIEKDNKGVAELRCVDIPFSQTLYDIKLENLFLYPDGDTREALAHHSQDGSTQEFNPFSFENYNFTLHDKIEKMPHPLGIRERRMMHDIKDELGIRGDTFEEDLDKAAEILQVNKNGK